MKYMLAVIALLICGCSTVNTLGPLRAEATMGIDWIDPGVKGEWFIGFKED